MPAAGKNAPRVGNLGHVTRIANKITQLGNIDNRIQTHIQVVAGVLFILFFVMVRLNGR